ncbi:hypothetical protein PoB_003045600 [Plakobranchus ocellatus]|uniref:Uncharacterized protein n=1 Tax=Plakobranchus ocellatus TaxID=259542 RepID=A0AAV4A6R1_9GAST|nr:hypothetical protein PoB_003045600 [Plakobranchus ocellatus]
MCPTMYVWKQSLFRKNWHTNSAAAFILSKRRGYSLSITAWPYVSGSIGEGKGGCHSVAAQTTNHEASLFTQIISLTCSWVEHVDSIPALRFAGKLLPPVRALPPAPWPDEGPENLRSPFRGLAMDKNPILCLEKYSISSVKPVTDAEPHLATTAW